MTTQERLQEHVTEKFFVLTLTNNTFEIYECDEFFSFDSEQIAEYNENNNDLQDLLYFCHVLLHCFESNNSLLEHDFADMSYFESCLQSAIERNSKSNYMRADTITRTMIDKLLVHLDRF